MSAAPALAVYASEAEWRQALAAVHPDRIGTDEHFKALNAARDEWRGTKPKHCALQSCLKVIPMSPHVQQRTNHRFCTRQCASRYAGELRRKPARLKVRTA